MSSEARARARLANQFGASRLRFTPWMGTTRSLNRDQKAEAAAVFGAAFLQEFSSAVAHLCERITGLNDDGKPKVFRDSAVSHLTDFFERFRSLNLRSNDQLDALVRQARAALGDADAETLRTADEVRSQVAVALAGVSDRIDQLVAEHAESAPRRRVIRPTAEGSPA